MTDSDRVGQILGGKLRVDRLVGSGGMGAVYVAEHLQLGKRVAVKFLHQQYKTSEEAVRRFSQEARAAAAIGHRGIVDVHDVGTTDDGTPYIVMELLEGESLRAVADRQRPLPIDRAVWVTLRVLSALGAAHAKGIVHRDLKPDNVFLEGAQGRPTSAKLLDFGISKMVETGARRATDTGITLGTADYMAPEQARAQRDIDHRVDLWAAGVMLYELVTGRLPFGEPSECFSAVIARILTEPPVRPRTLRPDLPEDLEAAILRALSKDRALRFSSAAELAGAIAPHAGALGGWDEQDGPIVPAKTSTVGNAVTMPAISTEPPMAAVGVPVDAPRPSEEARASAILQERPRRLRAAAAVTTLAVAALGAWAVTRSPAAPPPRARPAHQAPTAERPEPRGPVSAPQQPPASPRVTIELVGVPDGAKVLFDGAEVGGSTIRLAPRDVMVPLRVEVDGYEAFARMVTPDRDQRLEVSLHRSAPAKGRPRRPTGRGTPILRGTNEFGRAP